jgi:2-aminoadipate transaminase
MTWTLARRAARLEPSTIREILKVTERPGIVSLAGGLPAAETFPVEAMAEACARVLAEQGQQALQYSASEGFGPLRDWVAAQLAGHGLRVDSSQVLITTGSQQGLDLVGKVLIDPGSRVAVESPTYLGALQAVLPFRARVPRPRRRRAGPVAGGAGGRPGCALCLLAAQLPEPERPLPRGRPPAGACRGRGGGLGLPLVEDNPYGDLWFDAPPPPPLASWAGDAAVYLGSFSKVLAPGLRLGYLAAPKALFPKLLQAKQAADLHTPGFNQRLAYEVVRDGFLERHVPTIRARYKAQRDAMRAALEAPPARRLPLAAAGRRHVLLDRAARRAGCGGAAAAGGRRRRRLRTRGAVLRADAAP